MGEQRLTDCVSSVFTVGAAEPSTSGILALKSPSFLWSFFSIAVIPTSVCVRFFSFLSSFFCRFKRMKETLSPSFIYWP